MTIRRLLSVLAASAVCASAAAAESPGAEGRMGKAFVERFERLDTSRWTVSDGWSNGDWASNDWRRDQVLTGAPGLMLVMSAYEGRDKPYSSGEIRTIGERYRYGYFEIDMRVPAGSGVVSGFFTYTGKAFGDPHDEIDIEILGKNTRQVMLTAFKDGAQDSTYVDLGFDAADDYHLYAFEWAADRIRWYVDGKLVHELAGDKVPHTPQIYYLDLWGSASLTDWLGPLAMNAGPWALDVKCMAYAESYAGGTLCRKP